jgi:outer membrane protein
VEQAQTDDYDFVFDKSGMSTSQVPFILFAKDAYDITATILTDLNKDAPADFVPVSPDDLPALPEAGGGE